MSTVLFSHCLITFMFHLACKDVKNIKLYRHPGIFEDLGTWSMQRVQSQTLKGLGLAHKETILLNTNLTQSSHCFIFVTLPYHVLLSWCCLTFKGSSSERTHIGLKPGAFACFKSLVLLRWHSALIAVRCYF